MSDASYKVVPEEEEEEEQEEEENEERQALLISNVHVCGASGKTTSILIASERLITLDKEAAESAAAELGPSRCAHLDGTGLLAAPGLVDMHVHMAGGGGEASFSSRTPEALTSELISAGTTTVVGTTGTDSFSRSQANLQAKAAALREDGLTAYTWCGGYSLPPATATGSVRGDIALLPGCLGVGEVAVGDARGSCPTPRQLAELACEARTAGMLSGKVGLVHCHMGAGAAALQPLRDAAAASGGVLPLAAFHPTHVSRTPSLAADGAEWLRQGGTLDLTVSGGRDAAAAAADALECYRARGLPLGHVTLSTDAYGSLPRFDAHGALAGYGMARPDALLRFLRLLVRERSWVPEAALALATDSPARVLGLRRKGRLAPGADADVLLLDPGTLDLRFVVACGRLVKTPDWVRGGMFERGRGVRPRRPWPRPGRPAA